MADNNVVTEEPLFPYLTKGTEIAEFGTRAPSNMLAIREGIAESFSDVGKKGDIQLSTFNRYYKVFPNDEMEKVLSYVFIVRPDLNMDGAILSNPFFRSLAVTHPKVVMNLTQSYRANGPIASLYKKYPIPGHDFISFLVDRTKSYQIPDVQVSTYDFEQPFTSFQTTYARNSNKSRTGSSFDITFRDDKNLTIMRLFEAWVRYIDAINLGGISPRDIYAKSRISSGSATIDYATSIYLIDTTVTGGEILYFHKTTGAFPTAIPHSNYSFSNDGQFNPDLQIQFAGGLPEPLEPAVIADFNKNAGANSLTSISSTHAYMNPIVGAPFITYSKKRNCFMLRWRPLY